ncbi:hypothetical protein NSTC745_01414 [Nostoc sp. DSM 114161]
MIKRLYMLCLYNLWFNNFELLVANLASHIQRRFSRSKDLIP